MIDVPIVSWILLGLIAGLLGGKVLSRGGEGIFMNVGLAIAGAVTGGYLFNFFGSDRATRLDLFSVLVATSGDILVLVAYHGVRRVIPQRS